MYLTLDWSLLSKACLKISLLWSEGKRAGRGKIFKHLWLRSWHKAWMEASIKDNFKITERILARWLVESYGLWDFRPWNDLTCHAVPVVLIFRIINVIVKKKKNSTTIFHGVHSYRPQKWRHKMFKTLQWNHSPATRGSTWVLNILCLHFYGL